jgi:hypothetical protein
MWLGGAQSWSRHGEEIVYFQKSNPVANHYFYLLPSFLHPCYFSIYFICTTYHHSIPHIIASGEDVIIMEASQPLPEGKEVVPLQGQTSYFFLNDTSRNTRRLFPNFPFTGDLRSAIIFPFSSSDLPPVRKI